jgi:hypothetical protein
MQISFGAVTILTASLIAGGYAHGDHDTDFQWGTLSIRIPKTISDHSASYSPDNGLIFVAGGCGT